MYVNVCTLCRPIVHTQNLQQCCLQLGLFLRVVSLDIQQSLMLGSARIMQNVFDATVAHLKDLTDYIAVGRPIV